MQTSTDRSGTSTLSLTTNTCDVRLKSHIVKADINRCYEIVKDIPLRYWKWRDDVYPDQPDRHQYGWLAQDVEAAFPKAVRIGPAYGLPDVRQLDTFQLMVCMWGALQKEQEISAQLRKDLDSLSKEFSNYKVLTHQRLQFLEMRQADIVEETAPGPGPAPTIIATPVPTIDSIADLQD